MELEDNKISIDDQNKIAYKFADLVYERAKKLDGFISLLKLAPGYEKDYNVNISYSHNKRYGEKDFKNVHTVEMKFVFNAPFTFEHYRTFMDEVEKAYDDFPIVLLFMIEPLGGDNRIYLKISNANSFYAEMMKENNHIFRSLLGLSKFNL